MEKTQCNIDIQSLISQERVDKFDLLGQLILNQREALILCGVDGIGKSTLLKTLQQNREHLWTICFLQATLQFSLKYIKKELAFAIKEQSSTPDNENLHEMLRFYEEHQQKVVLILDNAGSLVDGLINALIEYALEYPAIRIIFALTKEELLLKNSTDTAIDDCYFIELPPLDRQHIGFFLQILSTLPEPLIKADEINDRLVKKLYQQTEGIPRNILNELQKQYEDPFLCRKKLIFSCCVLAYFALIYFYNPILMQSDLYAPFLRKTSRFLTMETVTTIKQKNVSKSPVKINNEAVEKKELFLNALNEPQSQLTKKAVIEQNPEKKQGLKEEEYQVAVEKTIEQKKDKGKTKVSDNAQWVLEQPSTNYTLQLMVVPTKSGLLSVLKQYLKLQKSLKYIKVLRKNKQKYILLYGSFENRKVAQKELKTLPKAFIGAWAKQFATIQKEIKK